MRIDFKASYKELSRVLDSSLKSSVHQSNEKEFGELLSSIAPSSSPNRQEKTASYKSIEERTRENSFAGESSPMGRFKFIEPVQEHPALARISPPEIDTFVVNESPESVKTPTLEAPRIIGAVRLNAEATQEEDSPEANVEIIEKDIKVPSKRADQIDEVKKMVSAAGAKHGVDPLLGLAVVSAESSFDPKAVSSDGHASKGLFQLLDSTGKELLERAGSSKSYDPFNPEMNVDLGVGYLRRLHELFSQESLLQNNLSTKPAANSSSLEKLAVAAFNAGEGRVASAQARAKRGGKDPSHYENVEAYLPDSTQEYVKKIMAAKAEFEPESMG